MPSSLHRLHSDHSDQPPEMQDQENTLTTSSRRKASLVDNFPHAEGCLDPGPGLFHTSVPGAIRGFNFLISNNNTSIISYLSGCCFLNTDWTNPWVENCTAQSLKSSYISSLVKRYKELDGAMLHQDLQFLRWSPRDTLTASTSCSS